MSLISVEAEGGVSLLVIHPFYRVIHNRKEMNLN